LPQHDAYTRPENRIAATALLNGWPGPAVRLASNGGLLESNERAVLLAAEESGWHDDLVAWVAAGGPLTEAARSVPVQFSGEVGVVEFTAVNLSGGEVLLLGRDVTLERRLRQVLTESRQRYKDLVNVSSDFAWETGPDGRFVFVSPAGAMGYAAADLVGQHPVQLVLPEFADQPLPFETHEPIERTEVWLRGRSGEPACLISSAVPLFGPAGEWLGARGACRDITEARTRGMELAEARLREKYLGFIVSSTRDDVDPTKTLQIAASVAGNATGAYGAWIFARTGGGFIPAAGQPPLPPSVLDAATGLISQASLAGGPVQQEVDEFRLLSDRTLFRNEINGALLLWRGVNEPWSDGDYDMIRAIADHVGVAVAQASYQERLKTLSERDGLTGLYNRRTFMEQLDQRLTRQRTGASALLYFDLDNFKAVNDKHGHMAGDEVLRRVGELLIRLARPADLAGRLGGDEFVLWVDRVDSVAALSIADRLLKEAADFLRPLSAYPEKPLGVSIGVALHGLSSREGVQGLVDRGDQAMYAAKRMGKGHRSLAPEPEETERLE
jgi:diguanylate cyclase (GGDEF)-like protein/PAS domain S-box-containing protein